MSRSKNIERRKEGTLIAAIKTWFKANEKLFWVLFLTAICFSFGFAMGPEQLMSLMGGTSVRGQIDGEEVTLKEWTSADEEIRVVSRMQLSPIFFSEAGLNHWDYLMFLREADRQGVIVSDEELGERIRTIYWSLKAASEDPANRGERFDELKQANVFDEREYRTLLRESVFRVRSHRFLQRALHNFIKIEKLKSQVEQVASVSPEEVNAMFDRLEQFRKLSFFEFELDEERQKAIAGALTEDELREFYDENEQKFRFYSPELKVDYCFVPAKHFEETLELTESEIAAEYEKIKNPKFRRDLEADLEDVGFELLSEEEEKERDAQLFQPLTEVREEVVASLKSQRSMASAAELARSLAKKMQPRPKGSVGAHNPGVGGGTITAEEALKEHPFLEVGTSEWFNTGSARDKLGNYWTGALSGMSTTANKNRNLPEDEREEFKLSPSGALSVEKDGYVFYSQVVARYPDEAEFEDQIDDAREKLAGDRLMEELEDKVKPALAEIANGSQKLEAVAEQFGATVHTTPFISRTDRINVPVEEDEEEGDKKEDDDKEDDAPKTEPLRGDYIVRGQGFSISLQGHCKVARDDFNAKLFLVRFDDKRSADIEEFTDDKKRTYYESILSDRRNAVFVQWRMELWEKSRPLIAEYGAPLPPPGEEAPATEQSAPEANASQ